LLGFRHAFFQPPFFIVKTFVTIQAIFTICISCNKTIGVII